MPHPFIIFPVQGAKTVTWMPVAVSQSTAKVLEQNNFEFSFYNYDLVVKPDSEFEPLVRLEREYGLVVSSDTLSQNFTISDRKYRMADRNEENAVIKVHPDNGFTPVYCVELPKEEKTEEE